MRQIFIFLILFSMFDLRQCNSVAEVDGNQNAGQTLESRTSDTHPRQFWGAGKSFSFTADKPPAAHWRVIAGGNEFCDGLMTLVGAPLSVNLSLPVFSPDNQSYFGQISDGKNPLFRSSVLERGFNPSGAVPQQSDLISVLKDIFRNEGVPNNLVWLAEVESSLNPEAESKAGAVGLFQLMPATAQRFGLQVFPVDDRKAPDKSARVAASYLRQLRDEFGCWALALAAYNAGEGRVGRAMKSNNARTFVEVAPHLPPETRKYVPRVMAIIALREDQMRGVPAACFMP